MQVANIKRIRYQSSRSSQFLTHALDGLGGAGDSVAKGGLLMGGGVEGAGRGVTAAVVASGLLWLPFSFTL